MSSVVDWMGAGLAVLGVAVMTLGTVGLWRLPDSASRLHALTKADHVGLGLLVCGLSLLGGDWVDAALMFSVWVVLLIAGTSAAQLLAGDASDG